MIRTLKESKRKLGEKDRMNRLAHGSARGKENLEGIRRRKERNDGAINSSP
jgi:hypothetical protein